MSTKRERLQTIFAILFLIIGALTVWEFWFVRGLFTGTTAMFAVVVVGGINVVFQLLAKHPIPALHYLLTSVALCMGYLSYM